MPIVMLLALLIVGGGVGAAWERSIRRGDEQQGLLWFILGMVLLLIGAPIVGIMLGVRYAP